jgi:hypothetical protein
VHSNLDPVGWCLVSDALFNQRNPTTLPDVEYSISIALYPCEVPCSVASTPRTLLRRTISMPLNKLVLGCVQLSQWVVTLDWSHQRVVCGAVEGGEGVAKICFVRVVISPRAQTTKYL